MNYVDPSGHEPHGPGSCYDYINGKCGGDKSNEVYKIAMIACGFGFLCENGNVSGSFGALQTELEEDGYEVVFFDVIYESDEFKNEKNKRSKLKVGGYMASVATAYPDSEIVIMGYSAGGDAAMIAYDVVKKKKGKIDSLVIIDPGFGTTEGQGYPPSKMGEIIDNMIQEKMSGILIIDPKTGYGGDTYEIITDHHDLTLYMDNYQ